MKRKESLINKVKDLLKRAKLPKRLHRFGPKTYFLWQHVFALFIKANCDLSFRRTTKLLRSLGFIVGTKSTLQRYANKLNLPFWQKILLKTINGFSKIVSVDATGLSKLVASEHYIKPY